MIRGSLTDHGNFLDGPCPPLAIAPLGYGKVESRLWSVLRANQHHIRGYILLLFCQIVAMATS